MNQQNDRLDLAIDRVANKMVSVDADQITAEQIVSQLPERSAGGWLGGYRLQFVGGAIALVAIAILSFDTLVRHNGSTRTVDTVVRHDGSTRPFDTVVRHDGSNDRGEPSSRTIVPNTRAERTSRTDVSNDAFDRAYGLPPVNAPVEIALKSIAVETELTVPASELAPIVLSDLPSVDDSSSRD